MMAKGYERFSVVGIVEETNGFGAHSGFPFTLDLNSQKFIVSPIVNSDTVPFQHKAS